MLRETQALLVTPFPLPTSQRLSYVMAHSNAFAWVCSACQIDSVAFEFLFSTFTVLCLLSLTRARKPRISDCVINQNFFLIFIIFLRHVNPKPHKLKMHIKRKHCTQHFLSFIRFKPF